MQRGTVAVYKQAGFGFISPEGGGPDVFFHVQDVSNGSRCPRPGDSVEFEVRGSDRGPRATGVRLAGGPSPEQVVAAATEILTAPLPDGECEVFTRDEFHAQVWAAFQRRAEELYADLEALAVRAGWVDG